METSKKWETLNTVACPRCGAPRPVNTNKGICDYWHYKFMNIQVMVTRKPGE